MSLCYMLSAKIKPLTIKEDEQTMKRTEIDFIETSSGEIKITGIRNVASREDIAKEFGTETLTIKGRAHHEIKPTHQQ